MYGGYGGMGGSMYGGMGSSMYGGIGSSMYGGYGGYNSFGGMGDPNDPNSLSRRMEAGTQGIHFLTPFLRCQSLRCSSLVFHLVWWKQY